MSSDLVDAVHELQLHAGIAVREHVVECGADVVLALERGVGYDGGQCGPAEPGYGQRDLQQRQPGTAGRAAGVNGDGGGIQRVVVVCEVAVQPAGEPGVGFDVSVDQHVVQDRQ